MTLLALGVNHKTAPVATRERVAFSPGATPEALRQLIELEGVQAAAILSTCNRTELYCDLDDNRQVDIAAWMSEFHQLPDQELRPYLYHHPQDQAIRHILRVACGLDSLVLGEPQILGQLKDAYQAARDSESLAPALDRLFQHSFSVAKQVRTDTAIGASAVSVAFAAVSLAKQIFGDLNGNTALLIGAGETIELAARHLHEQNIGRLIIANRTAERAHTLAAQFSAYAITLDEIEAHLSEADIVVASTASPEPILHRPTVEKAIRRRKHRPIFMVDIAVPRDIEESVGDMDDIYLYTVDDLQEVIEENLRSRQEAALQAEEIIDAQTERFMGWLRSRDTSHTIRLFRQSAESIRDDVMEQAQRQLLAGKDPQEVLRFLGNTLTNKLIHAPTSNLGQAGAEGRAELVQSAIELFNLKEPKD